MQSEKTRRDFMKLVGVGAAGAALGGCDAFWNQSAGNSTERPNILFIFSDDHAVGAIGAYGSRINQTPHIDTLAAAGVRFTDFHSAGPMCSPTRAAMLTGQYQQRFGRMFDTAISVCSIVIEACRMRR